MQGRYRVSINGFRCSAETWDDALNYDGKHDEVFLSSSIKVVGADGNVQYEAISQSPVLGDTWRLANRIQAGSASDRGGIISGDQFPTAKDDQKGVANMRMHRSAIRTSDEARSGKQRCRMGAVFVACFIEAAGCASFNERYADFTPTASVAGRSSRAPDQVELFFLSEEPRCKYRIVGLYKAGRKVTRTFNGVAEPETKPMREDAAKRGFDGIRDVECDQGNGNCSGKAFICET